MALPLLAPLAPLLPVLKVLALGSVKFIGIGIGAAVAPVLTANFLVGLSAGTPLKYAKFRHRKGLFSTEQLTVIENANELIERSLVDEDKHLNRGEAREFLKEVLLGTVEGMKNSIASVPGQLVRFGKLLIEVCARPFASGGNKK